MCAHGLETHICMDFQLDLAHLQTKLNLLMLNLIKRLFVLFLAGFPQINSAVVWFLGPVHHINQVNSFFLSELQELPAFFEGSSKKRVVCAQKMRFLW